ncbi:MAG: hypothetical protein K0S71_1314 [Clostridia bacterium]|jgi:hypothetical protein|nr:hypothetical protein [Clostridia bacterium]
MESIRQSALKLKTIIQLMEYIMHSMRGDKTL